MGNQKWGNSGKDDSPKPLTIEGAKIKTPLCTSLRFEIMAATSTSASSTQPVLETVAYLQKHGAGALQSEFSLSSKQHQTHQNLWLFKYHQTKSDFSQPIVRECRGLIVDFKANYRVVAYPYLKFFNYGEENAAEIDWSTARVYDKVDGSLATLYWYKGEWYVASSGTPDASGSMPGSPSFADIFWQLWGKMKYKLPTDTNKCYMFEMFARKQRIVVPVNSEMIYLHGVRDLQTLQEIDPAPIAEKLGYKMPQSFPLRSIEEVVEAAKKVTPDVGEGFVVVDAHFNRVKVKSPIYVAVAHLNSKDPSNLNYRSMLHIIRINEDQEFLSYFPNWKSLHTNAMKNYRTLIADISDLWNACKDAGAHDSESFGLAATKFLASKPWPNKDVYFNIVKRLQGGLYPTVLDFMQQCDIKVLLVLVERFGVRVIHTEKTKVKPLKAVTQQQQGKKAIRLLDQVQGPPKEPVFDEPTAASSSSTTSSTVETDAKASAATTSEILGDMKIAKKGKQHAKTNPNQIPKLSKAEQRRAAEEEEMRAFLQRLEDRAEE
jgi:hypothetical protein